MARFGYARAVRAVLVASVLGVALSALPAHADVGSPQEVASRLAATAEAHAKAGNYLAAATAYREAYGVSSDVRYLCNVGVAYHRAPDLARAQIYLTECVVRGSSLDAKFVSTVRRTLDQVEAELRKGDFTPVDISVEPANAVVSFDQFAPGETFVGARVFWVPFGSHVVTVVAEGHTSQTRTVDAQSHTPQAVRVELARAEPIVTPPDRPAAPALGPASLVPPSEPSVDRTRAPSLAPPVIATAATAALTVGAVVAYLTARSLAGDVDATAPQAVYDAQVEAARSRQHLSWGLGAAAGVGAVVSGYLWYRRSTTRVEVTPSSGGAMVSLGGTW